MKDKLQEKIELLLILRDRYTPLSKREVKLLSDYERDFDEWKKMHHGCPIPPIEDFYKWRKNK